MPAARAVDVLIVSLGSTAGLRLADDELRAAIERAGASAALVSAAAPPPRRTLMLTDLAWAHAARAAVAGQLARGPRARALIYSSTTAALLWPAAGAIRFDATAAANRRGRHGLWQRPLERTRLRQAPLLLPWSEAAMAGVRVGQGERALVVPVPVAPSLPAGGQRSTHATATVRDIAALTYAANPLKKGLDRVLAAWQQLCTAAPRGAEEQLVIAGASLQQLRDAGVATGSGERVHVVGELGRESYRALLRRARVFVCAPRREDYGIAQLEALADGCQLVTTAAPGPYVALAIARELDPRLVGEDLTAGLRAALEDPRPDYSARARAALAPFAPQAVDQVVAQRLLPRLLEASPA